MELVRETVNELKTEAVSTNERRLLVLHGSKNTGYLGANIAVETFVDDGQTVATVSDREIVGERIDPDRVDALLGTTYDCIILDVHTTWRPNTIGRVTGAVDGGGLLLFVCPPLAEWMTTYGRFETTLTAPPFSIADVGTRSKRRIVETLRAHRGIAIIDVDTETRSKHGCTDPPPRVRQPVRAPPAAHDFPASAYDACRSSDQRDAVFECETLSEPNTAVVLKADRGRGKSSAAGLAAAAFAEDGQRVLVTAPSYRNAAELFDRAAELLQSRGVLVDDGRDGATKPHLLTSTGEIRFRTPGNAAELSADVLFVDEAAALSVHQLESLLSVSPSVCFSTTVRGYEGAGRGFEVRFRDVLEETRDLTEYVLSEPIRYAVEDPIELWVFHALLLDATPVPETLIDGTTPEHTTYERFDRTELSSNESLLRELFGLLVSAHYRTQPDDLARLLDAPNCALRALTIDGHPVSVALLAREGGLDEETRRAAYEGERIRGNLIPDLLTSQLRDPDAGVPTGLRVLRIATHHAVRSKGFGSQLLAQIKAEYSESDTVGSDRVGQVDYIGVSYGATPRLISFWTANGYRTVHLSTTRNDASGTHSAIMIQPISNDGHRLTERHMEWFSRRLPGVLSERLSQLDPNIVREALISINSPRRLDLHEFEWRLVASAAYGPGLYDTAPMPFKRLAMQGLIDGALDNPDLERLLVKKVLQGTTWGDTAASLGFVSERTCKRTLSEAYKPLLARYGTSIAHEEGDRYRGSCQ